jgi:raffinose/stachyose/melibiose transport system permease protein
MKKFAKKYGWGLIGVAVSTVVFIVPFIFIFLTSAKGRRESSLLQFSWPTEWFFFENLVSVVQYADFMIVRAFFNSTVLTVLSVGIGVILAAMAAWVLARRKSKLNSVANVLILSGLMIPPAVVPTILLLQALGIFGTFPSMVLIEVAFGASFTIMLFRAFIASIPREIDEAAIIDGAGPIRLFFSVIFPLLRSVMFTAIILNSVFVFNDFVNPLYFLPGDENATIQLTLFNFQSQFLTRFNWLFMDILLITVPMVVMFAFFNKRIVAGMTAGSVKG